MSKKVFLDTNTLLDVILEREDFVEDATEILLLHEAGEIEIFMSALSLANIAYVVKKNGKNPYLIISRILKWLHVVGLEKAHFEKNIQAGFRDFEDGLQFVSALSVKNIEVIITRNKGDFKKSTITVLTPKEFLKVVSH